MSNTTKSVDELRKEMAGILYSDKSVMTSELNKLLNLVATKLQEAYKKGYIDGGIATLTQDTKGGTDDTPRV